MSDSVQPHRRQPTRLPCPWDSPGKNTGVGCHFLLRCMQVKRESEIAQSCPTLSNPMDCSPPGSSIHGIFQVRVLEWGATAFSNVQRLEEANFNFSLISREKFYLLKLKNGRGFLENILYNSVTCSRWLRQKRMTIWVTGEGIPITGRKRSPHSKSLS